MAAAVGCPLGPSGWKSMAAGAWDARGGGVSAGQNKVYRHGSGGGKGDGVGGGGGVAGGGAGLGRGAVQSVARSINMKKYNRGSGLGVPAKKGRRGDVPAALWPSYSCARVYSPPRQTAGHAPCSHPHSSPRLRRPRPSSRGSWRRREWGGTLCSGRGSRPCAPAHTHACIYAHTRVHTHAHAHTHTQRLVTRIVVCHWRTQVWA